MSLNKDLSISVQLRYSAFEFTGRATDAEPMLDDWIVRSTAQPNPEPSLRERAQQGSPPVQGHVATFSNTQVESVLSPSVVVRPEAHETILIRRILAGENELFMDLVRPYQKMVYSMAVSIIKNDDEAEDIAQEALFKAFKRLAQFRGESKFSTWIVQIALNEARQRLRRKQRAAEDSIECGFATKEDDYTPIDLADWREIPLEALQRKELRRALHTAISNLRPIYRDVLVLRDIQHLTVAETSDLLKISEASVKTRLLRARLQLRDALAPGFDGYWSSGSATYKRVRPF
jgi:RNA polymerase sigma-70 factor (ECF subfamily)